MTLSQAWTIASFFTSGNFPNSLLTIAAAFFKCANATMTSIGIFSLPTVRFWRLLSVLAAQNLSAGTLISPIVSCSILTDIQKSPRNIVFITSLYYIAKGFINKKLCKLISVIFYYILV